MVVNRKRHWNNRRDAMVVNRKRPCYTLKGHHGSEQKEALEPTANTMVANRKRQQEHHGSEQKETAGAP